MLALRSFRCVPWSDCGCCYWAIRRLHPSPKFCFAGPHVAQRVAAEVQDPKFYADTTLKGVEPELLKAAGGAVCEISVPPLPTMDEMGERLARLSPAAEQAAEAPALARLPGVCAGAPLKKHTGCVFNGCQLSHRLLSFWAPLGLAAR